MMDPIILHYGKGQLTGFLVDPNGVLDVVSIFCSSYQSSQNAQVHLNQVICDIGTC